MDHTPMQYEHRLLYKPQKTGAPQQEECRYYHNPYAAWCSLLATDILHFDHPAQVQRHGVICASQLLADGKLWAELAYHQATDRLELWMGLPPSEAADCARKIMEAVPWPHPLEKPLPIANLDKMALRLQPLHILDELHFAVQKAMMEEQSQQALPYVLQISALQTGEFYHHEDQRLYRIKNYNFHAAAMGPLLRLLTDPADLAKRCGMAPSLAPRFFTISDKRYGDKLFTGPAIYHSISVEGADIPPLERWQGFDLSKPTKQGYMNNLDSQHLPWVHLAVSSLHGHGSDYGQWRKSMVRNTDFYCYGDYAPAVKHLLSLDVALMHPKSAFTDRYDQYIEGAVIQDGIQLTQHTLHGRSVPSISSKVQPDMLYRLKVEPHVLLNFLPRNQAFKQLLHSDLTLGEISYGIARRNPILLRETSKAHATASMEGYYGFRQPPHSLRYVVKLEFENKQGQPLHHLDTALLSHSLFTNDISQAIDHLAALPDAAFLHHKNGIRIKRADLVDTRQEWAIASKLPLPPPGTGMRVVLDVSHTQPDIIRIFHQRLQVDDQTFIPLHQHFMCPAENSRIDFALRPLPKRVKISTAHTRKGYKK